MTRRMVCCPFGRAEASTVMLPAPSEAPTLPSERQTDPCRHWSVAEATPECASEAAQATVVGRDPPGENTAREMAEGVQVNARRARTSVASDGNGPPLRTVTRTAWRPEVSPVSGTGTTRRPGGVGSRCGAATRRTRRRRWPR